MRTYPLYRENGFLPKLSDIPEETAKAAKYMLVSYPLNPVCATANDAFYEELIAFAKKYNIAPKRVASLLDISACCFQSFIPHGGQIMLGMSMTGLAPVTLIAASYYPALLALATIITIQFGLLKTKEEKAGISLYPNNGEDDEV